MDTIVDCLLSCIMCSDCGIDLGLHCTRRHVGIVSVAMTCGCEPNVRMHKEPTTQALDDASSCYLSKNLELVYSTLITGIGHAGCAVFCNAMGIPSNNKRLCYNHCHF